MPPDLLINMADAH